MGEPLKRSFQIPQDCSPKLQRLSILDDLISEMSIHELRLWQTVLEGAILEGAIIENQEALRDE